MKKEKRTATGNVWTRAMIMILCLLLPVFAVGAVQADGTIPENPAVLTEGVSADAEITEDNPTAYFSFGTPFLDLSDRLIVSESGIPMQKLHGASKMENEEWQRLESSLKKLSRSPLYLDCTPAGIQGECLLSEFKSKADRLSGEAGVKLFFVDGFQATIPDWVQWEPDSLAHYSRKSLRLLVPFVC